MRGLLFVLIAILIIGSIKLTIVLIDTHLTRIDKNTKFRIATCTMFDKTWHIIQYSNKKDEWYNYKKPLYHTNQDPYRFNTYKEAVEYLDDIIKNIIRDNSDTTYTYTNEVSINELLKK